MLYYYIEGQIINIRKSLTNNLFNEWPYPSNTNERLNNSSVTKPLALKYKLTPPMFHPC